MILDWKGGSSHLSALESGYQVGKRGKKALDRERRLEVVYKCVVEKD